MRALRESEAAGIEISVIFTSYNTFFHSFFLFVFLCFFPHIKVQYLAFSLYFLMCSIFMSGKKRSVINPTGCI